MDERRLAQELSGHSRSALEQAVLRFTPYVSAVILHTLSGQAIREDVEELASDVFLALWTHAGELDPEQGLRPWLAAVARNKAKDWLRTHRAVTAPLEEDVPGAAEGPEEAAERREQSAALWRAVDSLPEPERTLFFRYYYLGDKLKDAAGELGLSQTAAKQKLFRGRKTLKRILTEGVDQT